MTDDPLWLLIVGLIAVATVYAFGHSAAVRKERSKRRQLCQDYYQEALHRHGKGQMSEALVAAGIACGHVRRHECLNLIAQVLDDTEHFASAAGYWSDARTASRSQAVERQAYYWYREARSFLKAGDSEFAYLRSRAAIELIDSGQVPKGPADAQKYYEHLRALRMISSLQHFKGTEGWAAARTDAEWLQANATVAVIRELGSGIVRADSARPVIESMTETLFASDSSWSAP